MPPAGVMPVAARRHGPTGAGAFGALVLLHLHADQALFRGSLGWPGDEEDPLGAELLVGEQRAAHRARALAPQLLERGGSRLEPVEQRRLQPLDPGVDLRRLAALHLLRILRR